MVQLQKSLQQISDANAQVVAISYDSVEVLAKFANQNGITYPLLSDEGSKTINAFGIHASNGYAQPGTFIVNREGKVLQKIFLDGYRERHSIDALLQALSALQGN